MILLSKSGAAAPFKIGQVTQGGTTGNYSGLTMNQVTLGKSGTLQSVTIFWQANAGISFLLGVYSNSANLPASLLATSALSAVVVGEQTLAMTTNPMLSAGTYWLAVQNQTAVSGYFDSGAGLGWFNGSQPWTGALPATPASGSTGAFTFSLYATLIG